MAIADYVNATGHNIKWDHFEILVSDKSDFNVNISFITCCLLYFTVKNFESLISFPELRFKKSPNLHKKAKPWRILVLEVKITQMTS